MYSWNRVANETVAVYETVYSKPRLTFLQRLARYKTVGRVAGYVACLLAITLHFVVKLVEWWQPRHLIDVVPDWTIVDNVEKVKEQSKDTLEDQKVL